MTVTKSDCEEDDTASSKEEEDGPVTYLALNATGTCGSKHYGETSRALSASMNAIEQFDTLYFKGIRCFSYFSYLFKDKKGSYYISHYDDEK